MSRVTYTDTPTTADQGVLREQHQVRLVTAAEEGSGIDALPNGVYGFTYSPGLVNAPMWSVRRFRSYETHKLADGTTFLIGFATPEMAANIDTAQAEMTIVVHPEPAPGTDVLVQIPYARIARHRQHSAPNDGGFHVTLHAAV